MVREKNNIPAGLVSEPAVSLLRHLLRNILPIGWLGVDDLLDRDQEVGVCIGVPGGRHFVTVDAFVMDGGGGGGGEVLMNGRWREVVEVW